MITLPRRFALALVPLVWGIGLPAVHAGVPWLLSRLATRHGWQGGTPGWINGLGLLPVAAGTLLLLSVLVEGLRRRREVPERMEVGWRPQMLLTRGPYAITRHPMYLGELLLWLGWSLWYGSVPVAAGFLLFLPAAAWFARREDTALAAAFGDAWRDYAVRVPRWPGARRE